MKGLRQFCTFVLQAWWFGIEVEMVQEVVRYQPMTPIPLAPPDIAGLINLRGQIVTAIDLRQRLGLAARAGDALPANVVVRASDGPLSLLVDEIGDVIAVDEQRIEPAPETVDQAARALLRGVYPLPDRLLLLLDGQKAITGLGSYDG